MQLKIQQRHRSYAGRHLLSTSFWHMPRANQSKVYIYTSSWNWSSVYSCIWKTCNQASFNCSNLQVTISRVVSDGLPMHPGFDIDPVLSNKKNENWEKKKAKNLFVSWFLCGPFSSVGNAVEGQVHSKAFVGLKVTFMLIDSINVYINNSLNVTVQGTLTPWFSSVRGGRYPSDPYL